jgi:hypothetical protein
MRLKIALLAGALGVALFALPAGGALSADATQAYIVQMLDQPAVLYTGGITGLSATKPAKGTQIDPNDADVRKYVDYLKSSHDKALERVGGGKKLYDYGFVFNGFAATLTEAQAEEAKAAKNVVAVTPDSKDLLDTFTTPNFLGLTGPTGYYQAPAP